MPSEISASLKSIYDRLIRSSQIWALKGNFDSRQARDLRRQAILINHTSYLKYLPAYQKLAREEGCDENINLDIIKNKLMFSEEIFKNYNQRWLDTDDFISLNKWLSTLYYHPVDTQVNSIHSIDGWIEQLGSQGIQISCSSGTSGTLSFVPRGISNLELIRAANKSYISAFFLRDLKTPFTGLFTNPKLSSFSFRAFGKIMNKIGLKDFDAVFLGFRSGKTGNQVLMRSLEPFFKRFTYLYDLDLSMDALRCLRRGIRKEEDRALLERLNTEVNLNRECNYHRVIESIISSIRGGQKIFIFGVPYQIKELCDILGSQNKKVILNKNSLIAFGGGWKSFSGQAMDRDSLVNMISEVFELSPQRIVEWYSMTEINALMMRCEAGRFHIPPLIEPVIFDEELHPLEGKDLKGIFGFLDPLAYSYPGFIISGDRVHFTDGLCECGLHGPFVTEIKRAQSQDIKGCGGIMSSIQA
jgi:hypothetical protein